MRMEDQLEEQFAGQRLLAMDPRTEKASRPCPACESSTARSVGTKNELEIVSCLECGTLYTPYSPWYSSARYYVDYHDHGGLSEPAFVRKRLEEITAGFSRYRQTNQLLDVGCGSGTLLEAARANGWTVNGVDVSPTAAQYVRSLGFEVFQGELQDAGFPAQQFDVITAGELLEHLFEPGLIIKEIARLLRPGGLFWTTTPHGHGLSARMLGLKWSVICPPEHLQLFSIAGLKNLLLRAGFREIRFNTEGGNPLEIWYGLKKSNRRSEHQQFDRVAAGYQLNETLTKSRYRKALKNTVNSFLNVSQLGDSLKVFSVR